MPNENPNADMPQNTQNEIIEKPLKKLDIIERDIENTADAEGYGIDENIKDAIVGLNANEINTIASCEGHTDSGFSAPWIEIAAPNEPEERFTGQHESFVKVAEKYNMPVEEAERMFNIDAYWEAMRECCENEETEAYKKWSENGKEELSKVTKLLGEFYENRNVPNDIKISIDGTENWHGIFRLHNGGDDYRIIEDIPSDSEKEELQKRIQTYQGEMKEFAQFLKTKAEEESLVDDSFPVEDPRRWIKLVESESDSCIKQYFNNLGLTKKMLSEKENILDIGADMRDFAAFSLKEGLNNNVISLEPELDKDPDTGIMEAVKMHWSKEIYDQVDSKTVAGVMEQLPFKDASFDLIVDHAAMPGFNYSLNEIEQMTEGIDKAFDEIIRVLKPGGEARLFPLSDPTSNEKWEIWRPVVDKKLAEIMASGKCSVFIESVLNSETGELMNEKRLILKKIFA